MNNNFIPKKIPKGSVLGLNYSGMHDTAVALVSPEGKPLFAISLERVSRVKQDGRSPESLIEGFPWERIAKVALSVEREYIPANDLSSRFHPLPLASPLVGDKSHADSFLHALDFIPVEKVFIPHHLSHAASAFWLSGFSNATCLIYDGGMSNENWFGGVFNASNSSGIIPIDQFSSHNYSNITNLYTAVTAVLGFSPLKHEGKITGLAAYGTATKSCRKILEQWLYAPEILHDIFEWQDMYSQDTAPQLKSIPSSMQIFRNKLASHTHEDIAATVQKMAEEHVLDILSEVIKHGEASDNLCLSGGLFANVKINQRASELNFESTFISPPMSDDGAALGAALQVVSENPEFSPKPIRSMFLGPSYSKSKVSKFISDSTVKYQVPDNPEKVIAELLKNDNIVAIYQGAMEFGPRALGNRSILTNANDPLINQLLNERLNRTEFMPFAPVCIEEDADRLFNDIERVRHSAEFMTVTVNCSDEMKSLCPAVVHIDGTARPQLVSKISNPFMHQLLCYYKELSGKSALVNTSFNVHEEPIVCTPEDALKGFFESGLDVLFIEGHLIKLSENKNIETEYLRKKIKQHQSALDIATANEELLSSKLNKKNNELVTSKKTLAEQYTYSQWLKSEWASANTRIEEHISELSSTKVKVEILNAQLDKKSKALAASENSLAEQLTFTQQVQNERDTTNTLLNEHISELSSTKAKVEILNAQLDKKIKTLAASENSLAEQLTFNQRLQNERDTSNAFLEERISELSSAEIHAEHLNILLNEENEALVHSKAALAEQHAHSQWLQNEWDAAKLIIDELSHETNKWRSVSDNLEHELQSVYSSKSWRLTWPLRKFMNFVKWLIFIPIRITFKIIHLHKHIAHRLLLKIITFTRKHPSFKAQVIIYFNKYPRLETKLRQLTHRVISASQENTPVSTRITPELGDITLSPVSDENISHLTPSEYRIYREFMVARLKHQKDND